MPLHGEYLDPIPNRFLLAALIFVLGVILGYITGEINRRILERAGVSAAVEGTAFERTMHGLGTSTVTVLAKLTMWFIIGVSLLAAIAIADVRYTEQFLAEITGFLPTLFVAIFVLIVGIVLGDKIEILISERLRGIKLPQANIIPLVAKYSIVYIAALIALGQIGVATTALLILLTVYVFAIVFIGGLALKDLLAAGAAGIYLFLNQPYGIGDEIRIDDHSGIVQEITAFTTLIEDDNTEYLIPNHQVFQHGVSRKRHD